MQDDREVAHLFKLGVDRGNALAQCHFGNLYAQGRGGLPKDEREAARLYKLAADQGFAEAQCSLGHFYWQGLGGLPQDDREAVRLFKLAADQEHPVGARQSRVCYEEGRGAYRRTIARPRAFTSSPPTRATPRAGQSRMFYDAGRGGLPQDHRQAARLYKLAADQGNALAQATLGMFFELGHSGLPKDYREAARFISSPPTRETPWRRPVLRRSTA